MTELAGRGATWGSVLSAARPFTSGRSGSDFAKLLMDGWVPAGIVLGISAAGLHDTLVTTSSGPWGTGNGRLPRAPGRRRSFCRGSHHGYRRGAVRRPTQGTPATDPCCPAASHRWRLIQYSPLITKKEPRITPASFDF